MRYERSLEFKRRIVRDALSRIGGVELPDVRETLPCPSPDRARNKGEYPIAFQDGRMTIGAFARNSHRVVPLTDCLLQDALSVRALGWFSEHIRELPFARHLKYLVTRVNRTGEMMLTLCADAPLIPEMRRLSPVLETALPYMKSFHLCHLNRRPAHALDGRCTLVSGEATLTETLMGLDFEVSPQSFFQVNPAQTERLYALALEAAGVMPGCDLRILDAYCGAGTITLAAARWARFATGIEIVPPAIENAKRNAARNGLSDRARFICADAAAEIPRLLTRGERFDAAILDPPRAGCDASLLDALAGAAIPAIAYVSCNPATLARDVKRLAEKGYVLKWAQPVDMFPWTHHVESVVKLTRAGS